MKTFELFSQGLKDFSGLKKEDLSNVFVLHGIVHWFMDEFDLGQQVFRECLENKDPDLAISLTPKELLLDAYERYLFVSESTWLSMLKDRYHPDCCEPVEEKSSAYYSLLCAGLSNYGKRTGEVGVRLSINGSL